MQKRGERPLYIWKPIPPTDGFVAVGMVATASGLILFFIFYLSLFIYLVIYFNLFFFLFSPHPQTNPPPPKPVAASPKNGQ